jgi:hypothetical protein
MFTVVMTFARNKIIIELFRNPQTIILVYIQYDTTDVNLELIVYGYDLVIS